MALYIAFLSKNLEYNTVIDYTRTLVLYHNFHGTASPDLSHFEIRQALVGVQRNRKERPYKRQPVMTFHLRRIFDGLNVIKRRYRQTFRACCVTAFFSLARSAILFKSRENKHLITESVSLGKKFTTSKLPALKTNKY